MLLLRQIVRLVALVGLAVFPPGDGQAAVAGQGPVKLLEVRLLPELHRLQGRASYPLQPAPQALYRYTLAPQAEVDSVTLDGAAASFRFNRGELTVQASPAAPPAELTISYTIAYPDRPPEVPVHDEDPGYGVSGTIQPEGTYLSAGSGWYPAGGTPGSMLLEVVGPEGYRAVTSGRFLDSVEHAGGTLTRWEISEPGTGQPLAAGPYQIRRASGAGVPVYAFFGPQTIDLADSYLTTAQEYLELYQQLFGPYPFTQFVIAENFFPTGYGYPGWTLLGSSVIRLPFIVKSSLVHEIAHCWWGNGVLPDRSRGNWSEGLATYVADYLVQERSSPAEGRDYRLKILRDHATLSAGGGALAAFQARHDRRSQVIGYGKAAMVFHMIRRQIGDQAFWAGLRAAVQRYLFQTASWEQLLQCFAEQGDPALVERFRPWLTRSDVPELSFKDVMVNRTADGWRVAGRIEQQGNPWPLQVPLLLRCEGEQQADLVTLTGPAAGFSFTSRQRPLNLQADPDADLMRQLDPAEIPATVNHLRAADPLTVYSCGSDRDLDPRPLQTLLAALRQSRARVLQVEQLPRPLPNGGLLVYGSGCLADLPVESSQESTDLLADLHQPAADLSLVAVLKRTDRPGEIAAIFLPGAGDDANTVARKIPHYGKYSALEFTGADNSRKLTWQATAGPLLIQLSHPERSRP